MTRASIRARVDAATPGPWAESGRDVDHDRALAEGRNPGDLCGLGCEIDGPPEPFLRGQFHLHADAAFVAAARQDVPLLLAVADAAAEEQRTGAEVNRLHAAWMDSGSDTNPVYDEMVAMEAAHVAAGAALRAALDALEAGS